MYHLVDIRAKRSLLLGVINNQRIDVLKAGLFWSTVAAAFLGAVQHAFDVNKRQRVIKFFSGYHKHVWLVNEFTVHLILKQAFSKQSPLSSICARTQRSVGCKINNGFRVCSQNVVFVFKIVLNIRQINFLA